MLKLYVKSKLAIADFKKNLEGASLIEYSLLIGLITAAVIAIILIVSGFIGGAWDNLRDEWSAGGGANAD